MMWHAHLSVTMRWYVCWDMRLDKLSKFLTKTMIASEDVESKHLIELKHQEYIILLSILDDVII